MSYKSLICLLLLIVSVLGQFYEDKRCRCICPSIETVLDGVTSSDRKLFIANVPPNQCNCDGVILPRIGDAIKSREQEYCPRCECKYEIRNTSVIKVVVIIVMWVLTLLMIYMGFLVCLDPLVRNKKVKFHKEYASEECHSLLVQGEAVED